MITENIETYKVARDLTRLFRDDILDGETVNMNDRVGELLKLSPSKEKLARNILYDYLGRYGLSGSTLLRSNPELTLGQLAETIHDALYGSRSMT